ncbi:hypothetical protein LTR56_013082 [Elasticomyces elasticus]|nr:hypothetical protein LTR56_013082 [Elasticomyces elasticus]KAK3640261.1 hypothetical protein LTR22_017096 [Elasticomyces elasticus]KAK4920538.1 hypothetical protein LTR49_011953 [Elasticomyces elasticus]KAK5758962.1 hypothetical protein LTS12_010903 [Elasticomyces elasticus]
MGCASSKPEEPSYQETYRPMAHSSTPNHYAAPQYAPESNRQRRRRRNNKGVFAALAASAGGG